MPATVTPASGSLGNKETASITAYTATPEAGSTVTQIVERINGVIVNTFNNPASLSRTLTAPNATWDTLAYFASHTASVTVTDSNGAQTVTTYSFAKTLATNASLLEATKANTDAKNRISTKRDLLASQVGLSAGSTFDAISAQLASGVLKKFASGTSLSSTSARPPGTQGSWLRITGLTFKPKTVIAYSFETGEIQGGAYIDGKDDTSMHYNSMYSPTYYFKTKAISDLSVMEQGGFYLRVYQNTVNYFWIAYE